MLFINAVRKLWNTKLFPNNHFLRNKEYDPSSQGNEVSWEGEPVDPPREPRSGYFGKWLPHHLFIAKMKEMLMANNKLKDREDGKVTKEQGYNKKVPLGYHTTVRPHVDSNLAEVTETDLSPVMLSISISF